MAELVGKRFDSPDEVRTFTDRKAQSDRPVKRLLRTIA
jgi:hypothetical protein